MRIPTAALVGVLSLLQLCTSSKLGDFEKSLNQSLLWGPYRPNLYFGIRPRLPEGFLMSLMWSRVEDYQSIQTTFRLTCEQNEHMQGYGWDRYDPRTGGVQTIHDTENMLDISTSFVKFPDDDDSEGGQGERGWAVRVTGTPRDEASDDLKSTVVFALAAEGSGLGGLEVVSDFENLKDGRGLVGDVTMKGEHPILGAFKIVVRDGEDNRHPVHNHASADERPLDRTFVVSETLPDNYLWQTKAVLFAQLKKSVDKSVADYGEQNLPPPFQFFTVKNNAGEGNHHIIQKVFEGPFQFDIVFSKTDEIASPEEITTQLNTVSENFDKAFQSIFKPQPPFDTPKYLGLSKALFSNLVGGIGYFYGNWKVDRSNAAEYEEENEGFWEETAEARSRVEPETEGPSELFTSVPSRPFFPRGFWWDEGFHLMPVIEWDVDLTMAIVKSWFNLVDDDGWVGREQILGPEARSKVPTEFQVQYPHYANPPTLFFILSSYVDKVTAGQSNNPDGRSHLLEKELAQEFLKELYPRLREHYDWFRRTQAGDIKSYDREAFSNREAYRWRGRTVQHLLTSGMDDYPRAQPPHPGELHVDAISWVGVMTDSLRKIAVFLGEEEDGEEFARKAEAVRRNIDDLHWSEEHGVHCDATIDEFEESVAVCHKGYVSIFPFILGLMDPNGKKVGRILDVMADEEELWSVHGIRSLSKQDEYYGKDENYWRGPVWININYLALTQLLDLANSKSPHKHKATAMYSNLRRNLVETVFKSWEETGFAWEQYNPDTGAGQRTQHFTGWTSLVVQIMAMPNIGEEQIRDEL